MSINDRQKNLDSIRSHPEFQEPPSTAVGSKPGPKTPRTEGDALADIASHLPETEKNDALITRIKHDLEMGLEYQKDMARGNTAAAQKAKTEDVSAPLMEAVKQEAKDGMVPQYLRDDFSRLVASPAVAIDAAGANQFLNNIATGKEVSDSAAHLAAAIDNTLISHTNQYINAHHMRDGQNVAPVKTPGQKPAPRGTARTPD